MADSSHLLLRKASLGVSSDPIFNARFGPPMVLRNSVDDYNKILIGEAEMPRLIDMAATLIHWRFGNAGYCDFIRPAGSESDPIAGIDIQLGCAIQRKQNDQCYGYYECIRLIRSENWFVIAVDFRDGRYLWDRDDWEAAYRIYDNTDLHLRFKYCNDSDGPVFEKCSFIDMFEASNQPAHRELTFQAASHFMVRALHSLSSDALEAKIDSERDPETPEFRFDYNPTFES